MKFFKKILKKLFGCCLDCVECSYNNTDKLVKKMKN